MSAPAHRIAHGEPAALPAGDAAWRVVSGRVEVYLVTPARRRLVAIVEAGGYLFPLPGGSAAALGLIAPGGATIEPGPDATDAELWESAGAWVRRAARPLGLAVADDLLAGPIVPAVQRFTLALDAHHHAAEERRDAEDLARLAVDPAAAGRATSGGGGIRRAIERAGAALGLAARRIEPGGRVPDFSAVPQLARAAGFRARRVVLPNGWWLADMGPLIVRPADQEGAQALVWRRGHYQDADGANVDEAVAAALDAGGYIAYPPLPEKVDGFVSLGRHVLAGIGGDMRVIALAGFAVALIGLIVPIATAGIFEDIVPAGAAGLLISVGIALVVAALLQALLGVAEALALARIEGRSSVRLAAGLTDRTLQLPASFFKTLAAGDLNQRIQSVEAMRALVVGIVLSSGLTALFSVVYLTLLFVRDARLALLALAVSLVYVAALFVSRMLQVGPLREAAAIDGKLAGVTHETLEGIAKLRTAAAEPRAMARWRTLYVREQGVAMKGGRVANRFAAFADAWQIVTLGSLFAAAAILSRSNLSAGQFLGFLTAFAIFQSSFVAFCEAVMQLMTAQPLAERARPLLTAPLESQAGRVDPGKLSGLIEAAGVSFGYAGEGAPLLSGLSFTLRPGEHMAIVGGSGSGKSTVLRLLLGFEAPRTGAILYDGQDLAGLDPASVRTQIGVVLQSSRLFAGSILENIRGASDLTLEQCLAAAERAGLAGDLAQLPMGVHTPITEGAGTLSGGQRQRILIARAIASEPTILFLDEATSALDNLTQAVVAETIDTMRVARVTIAHRLSTVRNADRICVLAGGRFVETGRYEELIARGGLFAELAQRQLMED